MILLNKLYFLIDITLYRVNEINIRRESKLHKYIKIIFKFIDLERLIISNLKIDYIDESIEKLIN